MGMACAIVEPPNVILLDEPFNALDESGVKQVHSLLDELRQEGRLILLAGHARQQMESLADEILRMSAGHIINEQ